MWGLIGVALLLAGDLLDIFGASFPASKYFLAIPIGLNEIVLAIRPIVKGFNSSAIAFESAKTDTN